MVKEYLVFLKGINVKQIFSGEEYFLISIDFRYRKEPPIF